jgi:hypothetical protein
LSDVAHAGLELLTGTLSFSVQCNHDGCFLVDSIIIAVLTWIVQIKGRFLPMNGWISPGKQSNNSRSKRDRYFLFVFYISLITL